MAKREKMTVTRLKDGTIAVKGGTVQQLQALLDEVNRRRERPPKDRKRHTCELVCAGTKDLVITDPCYVFNPEDWGKVIELFQGMGTVNGALAPQILEYHGLKMVIADTIFGDWCCDIVNEGETLGSFTADAGCVCCVCLSEQEWRRRLKHIKPFQRTVLKKFKGSVKICHQNGRCWVEGAGDLVGKFKSKQVG